MELLHAIEHPHGHITPAPARRRSRRHRRPSGAGAARRRRLRVHRGTRVEPGGRAPVQLPNTKAVYRWHSSARVSKLRSKSGDSGVDIGRLTLLPSHPTHLSTSRGANLSIRALAGANLSTRHPLAHRRYHRCSDTPVRASAENADADSWFVPAGRGVTLTRFPCLHR